jgi:hypothetical protein
VTLFPQTLINVRLRDGSDWKANAALADARVRAERELGASGPCADPRLGHRARAARDGRGQRRRRPWPPVPPSAWLRRPPQAECEAQAAGLLLPVRRAAAGPVTPRSPLAIGRHALP